MNTVRTSLQYDGVIYKVGRHVPQVLLQWVWTPPFILLTCLWGVVSWMMSQKTDSQACWWGLITRDSSLTEPLFTASVTFRRKEHINEKKIGVKLLKARAVLKTKSRLFRLCHYLVYLYCFVTCDWASPAYLCDHVDYSPWGSSVHSCLLRARILEWVAIPFSKGSYQPRNWIQVSCIAGRFFYHLSHLGSPYSTLFSSYSFTLLLLLFLSCSVISNSLQPHGL